MRILVGGQPSKLFHLREFLNVLEKNGHKYKLMPSTDYPYILSKKPIQWFRNNSKFKKLIKEFQPDIALVDSFNPFGVYMIKSQIPVFLLLRGDYWLELQTVLDLHKKKLNFIRRFVYKKKNELAELIFLKSTMIFPICRHLERITKERYPDKKTNVLYSGIDSTRWYDQPGMTLKHPCVGLLQGATIWNKTQEMLILETVLKQMPDVTFYWVGCGQYTNKILEKLEKYDNFKYLGKLDYPDKVREYLTEIDVYALVTGLDMSPLTLQEAQLMKKPLVATNVGGVPEMMQDGITGLLVKQGDANDLVEKLKMLFLNKQKAQDMGNAGREFVIENFNWDKIAQDFDKSIKSMI